TKRKTRILIPNRRGSRVSIINFYVNDKGRLIGWWMQFSIKGANAWYEGGMLKIRKKHTPKGF
ncbi:MAG TPA: hypothetical protein VM012_11235, partial [Flavitalea sp.]|nr:hypothetical protein [Flavitalea sp.]